MRTLPLLLLGSLTLSIPTIVATCQDSDQDDDGWTVDDGDCDDQDASVHPGATEVCDGVDNDCNDLVDTEDPDLDQSTLTTYYRDDDADGYGAGDKSVSDCDAPDGYVEAGDDCNDSDAAIFPGADEHCNGLDDDCDGETDEDAVDAELYYADEDFDSYGDPATGELACQPPMDRVSNALDCDDLDPTVNPQGVELCQDGKDNDCDGTSNGCRFNGHYSLGEADFTMFGSRLADTAGWSITSVGDMNGDGYADFFVGAPGVDGRYLDADDTGARYGGAFLVHGPVSGTVDLSEANAIFLGEESGYQAGAAVAAAGDVNGDGYKDLLIGAPGDGTAGESAGAAHLVYGPVSGTVRLSSADVTFLGENTGDLAGTSVAAAGDLNGDGKADLIIGAPGFDSGATNSGAAYVVFGGQLSGTIGLGDADARITGATEGSALGLSVAGVGDVNADGYRDILVGAPDVYASTEATGNAYLFFGPITGSKSAYDAGAALHGEGFYDEAGWAVASAGDLNSDGYADILVGAPIASLAYVLRGPLSGDVYLGNATARLVGNQNYAGWSVAAVGDVTGDGVADVVVGAPVVDVSVDSESSSSEAGGAYIVPGPLSGTITLSSSAIKLTGEVSGAAGYAVAAAGDVDNDGTRDLMVGAPLADPGGDSGGAVYILKGPITTAQTLAEAGGKIIGEGGGSYVIGYAVASAGDVDADGYPDVLIGAPNDDTGGTRAGGVYLMYSPVSGTIDYTQADVSFIGEGPYQGAGRAVASAGDVDADGYADIIIGAPLYYGSDGLVNGAAYVINGPVSGSMRLSQADAILLGEEAGDEAGLSVGSAGDINRDGYDDVLVGAPYHGGGGTARGAVYVINGPITGSINLADADAKLYGDVDGDLCGQSLASAGDVNGDGYGDILVGATGGSSGKGSAYLIYGPLSGSASVSTVADAKFTGENSGDLAGRAVAGGGDVNGDGYADILVGAAADSGSGEGAGAAYLVLGPVSGTVSLTNAAAKMTGEAADDLAGRSLAFVGDVDDDGYDDMLIGSPGEDSEGSDAGAAFLVYGPVSGKVDLLQSSGVKLVGSDDSDQAGWSVAAAGDVDGDGHPDLLIGAKGNDYGGSEAGAAYVFSTDAR